MKGKDVAELEKMATALNLSGVQNYYTEDKKTLTNMLSGQQHQEVIVSDIVGVPHLADYYYIFLDNYFVNILNLYQSYYNLLSCLL